ncbi:hypothetical protein ACM61V_14150 [Sphingomonas sp. TX0543]|uniref:hypothetical protein n=1 Tax=unclassified Sphingomonas TaxID=196159 RepID=UPI0010F763D9|nr:hypothetical protein [Sphingomonas sp. 3P27F8]
MLPSPRIFRSRWAALLWAGGIVWFAIDVADNAKSDAPATNTAAVATDATGAPVDQHDLSVLQNAMPAN